MLTFITAYIMIVYINSLYNLWHALHLLGLDHPPFDNVYQLDDLISNNEPDPNDESLTALLLDNQRAMDNPAPGNNTKRAPDSPQSAPEAITTPRTRRRNRSPHSMRSKSVLDKTELWEAKFKVWIIFLSRFYRSR